MNNTTTSTTPTLMAIDQPGCRMSNSQDLWMACSGDLLITS
jgi:hypothetical protein